MNGKVRNPQLINQLNSLKFFTKIIIIDAETPSSLEFSYLNFEKSISSRIIGRNISDTEIAIKESHAKCYKEAKKLRSKKIFIIEDDAEIVDALKFQTALLNSPTNSKAEIFSFYSPDWSVWKISGDYWRALFPPAGAVAYLINEAAIDLALSNPSFGLADWPIWARKIDFYLNTDSGVSHKSSESYPGIERQSHIDRSFAWSLRLRNLKHGFRFDSFLVSIWYPIVWKLSTLYACIFFRRKFYSKESVFLSPIFNILASKYAGISRK